MSAASIRRLEGPRRLIPRVILGTMWPDVLSMTPDDASRRVGTALDAGLNAFDTAPLYGYGRAEELLGHALRGQRDRVLLLEKVGLRWEAGDGEVMFREKQPNRGLIVVRKDSRPVSVRSDIEGSLARLGVNHLDLVQVHQRDRRTSLEETLGELEALREEGKLRWIGVSNFDAADTRRSAQILGASGLVSNQLDYSLLARQAERDVIPVLGELGIAMLAYSPTGRGLLGGSSLAERASQSRYASAVYRVAKESLEPVARYHGLSMPQLALAWVLGQPTVAAAVVGARNEQQIVEAAAAGRVTISDETMLTLADAFHGLSPEVDLDLISRVRLRVRRVAGVARRRIANARRVR